MDFNKALGQIRPITQLIGTLLIIAGAAVFFGVHFNLGHAPLEVAAMGFLLKNI